jgi:hypothetical protein
VTLRDRTREFDDGRTDDKDMPGDSTMKQAVGLWIDHRKAVIVTATDRGESSSLIVSRVEKQLGRFAGLRSTAPYASQQVPADDRQERRYKAQLATYYDAVIAAVRGAESILIFGPGEAKGELTRRLTRDRSAGRIVGVETIDKLTDRQIAAKVRQHFSRRRSPGRSGSTRAIQLVKASALARRGDSAPSEPKTGQGQRSAAQVTRSRS